MPLPVIVDTDPGRDDAVALALACGAPGLDVRALTTVAGNVSVDKTTRNALRILALIGRTDIPVAIGAEKPLVREPVTAEHVHGGSGLHMPVDRELPEPRSEPDPRDAVGLMADVVEGSNEPVTLIAIGPLTNLATFLDQRPDLAAKIERVVVMGGSIGPGNTTPAAEFNVYVDPEAARAVFRCGRPVTMAGLDVTRRVLASEQHLRRLRGMGEAGSAVAELMLAPEWRLDGGAPQPVHDAVAVAAALEPDVLTTRPMRVEVECTGEHTTGETVCDAAGISGNPPNADVAVDVGAGRVMELLLSSVERLYLSR